MSCWKWPLARKMELTAFNLSVKSTYNVHRVNAQGLSCQYTVHKVSNNHH